MARIDISLEELLAPIRQMREEIQKMNESLRETAKLQAQMRSVGGQYADSRGGFAAQVRDLAIARGAPPNNVFSIQTGQAVPPTNINPAGIRQSPVDIFGQQLGAARQGANIITAIAGQAGIQSPQAKREMEELHKVLRGHTDKSGQLISDFLKKSESELSQVSKLLAEKNRELALAMANNASNVKELTEDTDALATQFNKLESALKKGTDAADQWTKAFGGGGGGGAGGGGLFDLFRNLSGGQKAALIGGAAVGAAGFAVSGAGIYMGMRGAGLQQDYSNTIAMAQAKSDIGAIQRQNYFAMAAPTTGEQMLRAYGNLLAPAGTKYQYLGFQNRTRLQEDARRLTETSRSAELLQAGGALTESAGGLITSAGGLAIGRVFASQAGQKLLQGVATRYFGSLAATAIGGPAAPLLAAGLTAYSAYDLVKGGYGLYKQYQEGMGTRVGQEFGGRIFGNQRLAIENQRYQRTLENLKNEEILRQGELSTFGSRQMAMGLDEYISMLRNRVAATSTVGGRAALGIESVLPKIKQEANYQNIINQINQANSDFSKGDGLRLMGIIGGVPPSRAMVAAQGIATRYAELGYTFNEAGNLKNALLASQQNVSDAQLMRAMQLTRAGVGTGEQIAAGILGISSVSGKVGDLQQLEKVFARAFSAGLNGSPAIQKFVQSSNEISAALKLQSATGAADILGSVTAAMRGASGSSLMFMSEAQKGISGFAATTGATTGLMGALKVITGAGAGLTSATGLGLLSGANAYQIQDAIKQIESGVSVEQMTGLARQMVGAQRYGGASSEAARTSVLGVLKRGRSAIQMPFAAGYQMATGESFASIQGKAAQLFTQIGKGGKSAQKAREDLKDLLYSYGSTMVGMGGADNIETAQAQFLASLPQGLIESNTGKKALESEISRGQQAARSDFISVNYKKMLNMAAMQAVGKVSGPVGAEDIKSVAQSLGINTGDANWYQQLQSKAMASGVDIKTKTQGQVSFRDLANIISAAGGEEMSKKSIIIEDISGNALQRLQRALGLTASEPEAFDGVPGPNK